jgi:uncharacterized protein YjdB
MQRRAVPLVVCLSLTLSGCGLLFMHGPPPGHEHLTAFSCTTNTTAAVADFVGATLSVVNAVALTQELTDDSYYVEEDDLGIRLGASIAWSAFLATSGFIGLERASKCRDAQRALATRLEAVKQANAPPRIATTQIDSLLIDPPVATLAVGATLKLSVRAFGPAGMLVLPADVFKWSSSNDAIASVRGDGLVTAHANGDVYIKAAVNQVAGAAALTIGPSN